MIAFGFAFFYRNFEMCITLNWHHKIKTRPCGNFITHFSKENQPFYDKRREKSLGLCSQWNERTVGGHKWLNIYGKMCLKPLQKTRFRYNLIHCTRDRNNWEYRIVQLKHRNDKNRLELQVLVNKGKRSCCKEFKTEFKKDISFVHRIFDTLALLVRLQLRLNFWLV